MTNDEQRQLISPICFSLASALLVALLVYDAAEIESGQVASTTRYTSARNQILGAGIRALAEVLGFAGSIVTGGVLIATMVVWLVLSYRRILRARRMAPA